MRVSKRPRNRRNTSKPLVAGKVISRNTTAAPSQHKMSHASVASMVRRMCSPRARKDASVLLPALTLSPTMSTVFFMRWPPKPPCCCPSQAYASTVDAALRAHEDLARPHHRRAPRYLRLTPTLPPPMPRHALREDHATVIKL